MSYLIFNNSFWLLLSVLNATECTSQLQLNPIIVALKVVNVTFEYLLTNCIPLFFIELSFYWIISCSVFFFCNTIYG
jgi:hypothetical protein